MKKIIIPLLILMSNLVIGQNSTEYYGLNLNLKKYDNQWYHFGFTLGMMKTDLKVDFNEEFMGIGDITGIESKSTPGFNVGIVCDLKVAKNLNFRFIPSLTFTQRDLLFNMENGSQITEVIENSNLDLPFLFKYRATRFQNIRPYFIIGGRFTYDMASKEEVDDVSIFKLKNIDYGIECGFGIDMYLAYFKLSPEIKYFYGINNMLVKDSNTHHLSSHLDALYSRTILFSLTFE